LTDYEFEGSRPSIWNLVKEHRIAQDPTTPPAVLQKIGLTHKLEPVRKLVARNPNTPESVLLTLAEQFPQEVAENPMFMLMYLENPEFIREMPYQHLVKIILHDDAPPIFINGAIHHGSSMVLKSLLSKPQLSSEQLECLIDRVESNEMVHLFLSHQNCNDSTKLAITKADNPRLQIGLAKRCLQHQTEYSIILLETLIEHGSLKVQGAMACNVTISDAWLDRLLTPDRKELHQAIAESGYRYVFNWHTHSPKKLSDRLQLRLAQNQLSDLTYRISVRQILAENKVNPDILELLSRDPYAKVRATVAKRSDLPQDMLLQLAQDPAAAVQHSLIKNKSIDTDRLTAMAQTSHPRMRELAAQHPNTTLSILETLVDDPRLAEHVARNPNTTTATLQKIAAAGTEDIALTQNSTIPDSIVQPILAKLAIDPNYTRRKLVARHPQTPRLILEQLAQDPEPKVQRLAQQRLTSD
jgi:hypothetical protein